MLSLDFQDGVQINAAVLNRKTFFWAAGIISLIPLKLLIRGFWPEHLRRSCTADSKACLTGTCFSTLHTLSPVAEYRGLTSRHRDMASTAIHSACDSRSNNGQDALETRSWTSPSVAQGVTETPWSKPKPVDISMNKTSSRDGTTKAATMQDYGKTPK